MFHSGRIKGSCRAFTGTISHLPIVPGLLFASFLYCCSPFSALHPCVGPGSFVQEPGTTLVTSHHISLKPSSHTVPQRRRGDTAGSVSQLSHQRGGQHVPRHAPLAHPIRTHGSPSTALPWAGGLRGGSRDYPSTAPTAPACQPAPARPVLLPINESPNKY